MEQAINHLKRRRGRVNNVPKKGLNVDNLSGIMFENPVPKGKKWPQYKGEIRIGKVKYQVVA